MNPLPQPFGALGALPAGLCKCGRERHPFDPDRCAAGHTWLGTPGPALNDGGGSALFWAAQEEERRDIVAAVIADAGYTLADAPMALRLACDGVAQAALLRNSAFLRIAESGGPSTSSGRTRRAFSVWQMASDRLERHLRLVGLRRLPKPTSLNDFLAGMGDSDEDEQPAVEAGAGEPIAAPLDVDVDSPPDRVPVPDIASQEVNGDVVRGLRRQSEPGV